MSLILAGVFDSPYGRLSGARLECLDEIAHLANVVIHVGGAHEKESQPSVYWRLVRNRRQERLFILGFKRLCNHVDSLLKPGQQVLTWITCGVGELNLAMADIAGASDERSNIVI